MFLPKTKTSLTLLLPLLALSLACSDDTTADSDETTTETSDTDSGDGDGDPATQTDSDDLTDTTMTDSETESDSDPTGDGDGDLTDSGDGDGDSGDGDGDSGDGDGDSGDGDGDSGDGDGDSGDGDGDEPEPEPVFNLVDIEPIGGYETGVFDESATEIVAYDPASVQLFVGNGAAGVVDVLDFSDPTAPAYVDSLDVSNYGAPTSVALYDGLLAVAVVAPVQTDPGFVVFFDAASSTELSAVTVGALPDMVTFSPDGTMAVAACEGEPDELDPDGSVAIIDTTGEPADFTDDNVALATFDAFNLGNIDPQVRIFPGNSVAQDVEPEYVTISADSTTAWVTLQENNSVAVVDLQSATVNAIVPLGYKNHSQPGMGLDPSDEDGEVSIQPWPVFGMYMPDAIVRFSVEGQDYLLTANEGDARDEDDRVRDITLDANIFPDPSIQDDEQLGRLDISLIDGDIDNDGEYERLYAYGARSMSVWAANGNLLWDSGDAFEQITSQAYPEDFNSTNDANESFEGRSDNKGPEPEGAVVAELWGKQYAFVGLERIGGIMVYDVSTPNAPEFVLYDNSTRDFAGDAEMGTAGDLGPEGLIVIQAEDSPNGLPLLVVANEVSGTVRVYELIAEEEA